MNTIRILFIVCASVVAIFVIGCGTDNSEPRKTINPEVTPETNMALNKTEKTSVTVVISFRVPTGGKCECTKPRDSVVFRCNITDSSSFISCNVSAQIDLNRIEEFYKEYSFCTFTTKNEPFLLSCGNLKREYEIIEGRQHDQQCVRPRNRIPWAEYDSNYVCGWYPPYLVN